MSSNKVFAGIEAIASTNSKKEKERLVQELVSSEDSELFKRVLTYALDPFRTYGIAKRPETIGAHVGHEFDDGTWDVLNGLSTRTLTGNAAIEAVRGEMTALSKESAELFWRIIKKDLRAGFSESTVNKVSPGLIVEIPYMRCGLPNKAKWTEWEWEAGVISQEKADGLFANLDNEETGFIGMTTRAGNPFPYEPFAELLDEAKQRLKPGTQSHGELLVVKAGVILPREIGNGILRSVQQGGAFADDEKPIYKVWDQVPLETVAKPKGKYNVPYRERLAAIVKQLRAVPGSSVQLIETKIVHSLDEAYEHYFKLLAEGKEGTIVKRPTAIWKDGTSLDQIKLKLEVDVDLVIKGINPGKEGTKNEGRSGAFACETSDGLLKVDVTVKNEAIRDDADANPDNWLERILVVRFNNIQKPSPSNEFHSLFLPRMAEEWFRTDKIQADSLARVIEQFENAVRPKK